MSTQAKDAGDFNLIITAVDAGRHAEATAAFSKAFSLDEGLAAQILKSSPIIFAQKLTRAEVKAITGKLAELSNVGMEFRVTARVAGRVPKINWPIRPQFTAADSGAPGGIAFEWDNNAFVCPSCGETFLFRRLGKLKLAEAPANGSGHAKQVSTKVGAISEEELGLSDEELDVAAPDPVPEHEGAVAGVEGVEPLPGEGESLDLPDAVEEIQLDEAEPAESAPEFAGASVPVADEAPIAAEEPAVEEVVPE
ncbi:MAG: hypothetical protein HYY16_03650, partial [Planctomycetes bacterium]|nr:hypothetical protein [Planctomycetota bacterium]